MEALIRTLVNGPMDFSRTYYASKHYTTDLIIIINVFIQELAFDWIDLAELDDHLLVRIF